MTHTNSITFDLAWYSILSQYSASIRRNVCDAVLNFAATGEKPMLKGLAKLAFEFISHEISKQMHKPTEETATQPETQPENDESAPQEAAIEPVEPLSDALTQPTPETCMEPEPEPQQESEVTRQLEEMPDEPQSSESKENEPVSHPQTQEYHSPAPSHKPCEQTGNIYHISKNIGKVICKRKGSKIIFRRR
ncbi:MAG: hypothetical protein K2M11_00490 [Paramuribaculum sp.]|nr:hypothetical protein [Paramuribaculum sp.]